MAEFSHDIAKSTQVTGEHVCAERDRGDSGNKRLRSVSVFAHYGTSGAGDFSLAAFVCEGLRLYLYEVEVEYFTFFVVGNEFSL